MLLHLTNSEIFWRLLSTLLGSFLFGIDRGERGHAAGLRTVIFVGLAACLAMLQANALLDVIGKTSESFSVMDTMRFPLGILSGIGFIGGGAILKRGQLVTGVTTAATLWLVTVIGLCFGGGQLLIGWIGVLLGFAMLTLLRKLEYHIPKQVLNRLIVEVAAEGPKEEEIRQEILKSKATIEAVSMIHLVPERQFRFEWTLCWTHRGPKGETPELVHSLCGRPGLLRGEWS